MSRRDEIKGEFDSLYATTRERMTLDSPELFFFLLAALSTLGMIFKIFDSMGPKYGSLDVYEVFAVLAQISVAFTLGFLIFLTAFLSLYYDTNFKLVKEEIYNSNFIFTRLFTSFIRAAILLVSLTIFLYSFTLF